MSLKVQVLNSCCSLAYLSETGAIDQYKKATIAKLVKKQLREQGNDSHSESIKAVMFVTNKGFFYRLGLRLKYGCYRGIRYRGLPLLGDLGITHRAHCMIMPLELNKY